MINCYKTLSIYLNFKSNISICTITPDKRFSIECNMRFDKNYFNFLNVICYGVNKIQENWIGIKYKEII